VVESNDENEIDDLEDFHELLADIFKLIHFKNGFNFDYQCVLDKRNKTYAYRNILLLI